MLAVAIRAIGCIARAIFQRFAMHAFVELARDFLVTLRASRDNVPMADFRLRFPGWQDTMTAVAIRASCSVFSLHNSASMNALLILLDWMQNWNPMPGKETRIRMACGAGSCLVSLRDSRSGLARRLDRVHRPMA